MPFGKRSELLPGDYLATSEFPTTPSRLMPLPRTRLGKIQRHLLIERFEKAKRAGEKIIEVGAMAVEEMSGEDRAILENAAAESSWELLARRYPGKRLTPDTSPQFDLGIDSLEWLNLTLEIAESSGVELTDEAIARIETVRDLLREVTEAGEGQGIDPVAQPYEILDANQKRWLKPLGPIANLTARFVYAFDRLLMRLLFHLHVEGLENLPKDEPWVLIPNHVSYLDPIAVAAVLKWNQLRETYWAGSSGIFSTNVIMRFLSWLGRILPVESTRAARTGLALGAIILNDKKNLVWFPEGGLSPTGNLQPFKPGIGMLLERFPRDAIPVFVSGSYEAVAYSARDFLASDRFACSLASLAVRRSSCARAAGKSRTKRLRMRSRKRLLRSDYRRFARSTDRHPSVRLSHDADCRNAIERSSISQLRRSLALNGLQFRKDIELLRCDFHSAASHSRSSKTLLSLRGDAVIAHCSLGLRSGRLRGASIPQRAITAVRSKVFREASPIGR